MIQRSSSVRLSAAPRLLDINQLVVARAQPDLLAVLDHGAPVGVRVREVEVIVLAALRDAALGLQLGLHVRELGVGQRGRCQRHVDAGLVDGHGVKAREHAEVGHDRRIVLRVAVAVGADVHGNGDVEARAVLHHGLRVLGNLAVEHVDGGIGARCDGVLVARADAAAAADADVVVDMGHGHGDGLAAPELALEASRRS